ncbi:2522_t:CDS:2, partial [Entrophospora sp. SA101]
MPEMVEDWINELKNVLQNPDEIFIEERDSFGLFEALEQNEFKEQFVAFSKVDYTQLQ